MADGLDSLFVEATGCAVSECCSRLYGRKEYLRAAESFWNKNAAQSWERPRYVRIVQGIVDFRHPQLVEVGWFLYQKALLAKNPAHPWKSQFKPDSEFHSIDAESGDTSPVWLPNQDFPLVEQRAQCLLATWGRAKLLQQLQKGEISLAQATAEVKKHKWLPIEAKLADDWNIPKQKWLEFSKTVVVLVTGKPSSPNNPDARLAASDFIRLGINSLLDGAYADHVHLYGKRGSNTERSRIVSDIFQKRPSVDWTLDRLCFYPRHRPYFHSTRNEAPDVWSDVLVDVYTLKNWKALCVEEQSKQLRLTSRGRKGPRIKANDRKSLYANMQNTYEGLMTSLQSGAKRTLVKDREFFEAKFGYVPRGMVEDVRDWWKRRQHKTRIPQKKPIKISSGI